MMFENPDDNIIREILSTPRRIAVIGCSPKIYRDSNRITQLLIRKGHDVVPVNPNYDEVLGLKCYPDLLQVPEKIYMVDVFRRPEYLPQIAEQAVAAGAKVLWGQLGVYNEQAAEFGGQNGLIVVMDRCPAIEYRTLGIKTSVKATE